MEKKKKENLTHSFLSNLIPTTYKKFSFEDLQDLLSNRSNCVFLTIAKKI